MTHRCKSLIGLAAAVGMAGCSTGTVDRQLFAHTEDETYARVRAAVPSGTPLETAETTLKALGWSCYVVPRARVVPNDTKVQIDGRTLRCDAYPSLGGYPFSREYDAAFLITDGQIGPLQVDIVTPTV